MRAASVAISNFQFRFTSRGFDREDAFMQCSCMSKTITIDDDVYKTLSSLKQGAGDSFTKVLRRHVVKPAETAGELLDAYENAPPPKVDPVILDRLLKERGRRSRGR